MGVTRDRIVPMLALFAGSSVVPASLLHFLGRTEVHVPHLFHFVAIAAAGVAAACAAVGLSVAGARRRDGRAVLVGTAFSVMAAMLAIHGLATPEAVLGAADRLFALAGAANLPVGGAVLALSALPALRRPEHVRRLLAVQGSLLALVAAGGAAGMLAPGLVPELPEPGTAPAMAVLAGGIAFFLVLAVRAGETFLLTRRRADLLVAV